MFGTMCCTYIPNNTAPYGSVTKALQGLIALSQELARNTGVDDMLGGMLDKWFGQYKTL